MNLAHWLRRRAMIDPDRPALFRGTEALADYATFDGRAAGLARGLAQEGVSPGDRVAIWMQNCPAYLVALYGIWMAGAVAVPVNAKLHPREAGFILRDSGCALALVTPALGRSLAPAPCRIIATGPAFDALIAREPAPDIAARGPDDMAWLFYTSGTTGTPKGVMITHGNLAAMALCYTADVDTVSAEDTALYAAPLSHGAGLYSLMHVRAGAAHVCPVSGGFDPGEVMDLAEHFGRVHMFAAPTMVKRLTRAAKAAERRGTGLRSVVYAGGPMYNADIIEAVDWFGPVFLQIYGQGECPMGITALTRQEVADRQRPGWRDRLASVGTTQSAVEVIVAGPDGTPLPTGTRGEILVRGATVMPGYWQNPEATAKTLQHGWLRTGDIGTLDAAGYLTLHDRSKDVIITGGSNVYPREVEEILLTHPDVREASVIGRPHPEWGEEILAFIVGEAPEDELDALCLDNLARFKRPKHYLRLSELPKNNYGKVLKTALRDLANDAESQA